MAIYGWFKRNGPTGFGYNSTAEQVTEGLDLTGKTYLVTGVNSGLGLETMRVLSMRGAHIIGAARSEQKAADALSAAGTNGVPVACELSEPDSVREAVKTVLELGRPLDGIIANAGIMMLPQRTVKHGLDMQFLTNHIGHAILVLGVLDLLADDGRVVMLSSEAHRMSWPEGIRLDDLDCSTEYSSLRAYGQSKLANMLFANGLSTRLPKPGQSSNSVHPGVIMTNLGRHMVPGFLIPPARVLLTAVAFKSIPQGAATQCFVATHPQMRTNGEFYEDCNLGKKHFHGRSDELTQKLWAKTEELIAGL